VSTMISERTVGERFAVAIAARDAAVLTDVLADDVDFRGMTPGRFWEARSASEVVDDIILGHWFEPSDHIEAIERIDTDVVADCQRMSYRFRVQNHTGTFTV
jgi:hypothetical protein